MTIYMIRRRQFSRELIEFSGKRELAQYEKDCPLDQLSLVNARYAHQWVKNGHLHNTPLWVDDNGRIRRA